MLAPAYPMSVAGSTGVAAALICRTPSTISFWPAAAGRAGSEREVGRSGRARARAELSRSFMYTTNAEMGAATRGFLRGCHSFRPMRQSTGVHARAPQLHPRQVS